MSLGWRPGCLSDLPGCLALLQGHCAYHAATLERVPVVWRKLFQDAAITLAVVEDRTRPQNPRLLAFGASVFVTDAFMARERVGTEPYLTGRAIQAWRQIYDRVAAVYPELLPDRQEVDGRRGDEKRRRVTEYLRQYLEELRS